LGPLDSGIYLVISSRDMVLSIMNNDNLLSNTKYR